MIDELKFREITNPAENRMRTRMAIERSIITPAVRERMIKAGYDEWMMAQAAKGKTAKQRLARELVGPDDVPDADDSSLTNN